MASKAVSSTYIIAERKRILTKLTFYFFFIFRFLVFLFLLPLVQTYFFNLAVGHDPKGLYIAVVNDEYQQGRHGECQPQFYDGCFIDNPTDVMMSCAYVEQIKLKSMNVVSSVFETIYFNIMPNGLGLSYCCLAVRNS